MKRLVTAFLLLPVVCWLVLYGPKWAFLALLAVTGIAAFHEYAGIVAASGVARPGTEAFLLGFALLLAPDPAIALVALVTLGAMVAALPRSSGAPLGAAAAFVFGVLYIFGAWRCAAELFGLNRHWLMFALVVSWTGDTGGLYVGRALGRHKMAPRISPAKTWEGAAGSMVASLAAGAIYAKYLIPEWSFAAALGLAVAGNTAAQTGDLCESAMKRGAGVKDSGSSLPGHGGWLDRIDSTLFAVPVLYVIARVFLR